MNGHEILWADEFSIGYRCYDDAPGTHTGVVHGLDERDRVVACERCGQHLHAAWAVTLISTEEPLTEER